MCAAISSYEYRSHLLRVRPESDLFRSNAFDPVIAPNSINYIMSFDFEQLKQRIWRPKPLSILVADDIEDVRTSCQLLLEEFGHRVVCASDGNEAACQLRQQNFDLVIADVVMPVRDGLELIIELRRALSPVRILAMSGGGRYTLNTDCLNLARNLGAHAVITKPFDLQQLIEGIEIAIGESRPN
jgi:CheY-like chemotaxis protein